MKRRDALGLTLYLPFLAYAFFSFTGKLYSGVNSLYLLALPVAAAVLLIFSSHFWFFFAAIAATNLAVQLTGGATSQLFFFYFLLLFVEGLRASSLRYIIAAASVLVLESGSAIFHLSSVSFPYGQLAAFAGFAVLAFLFLRKEKRFSKNLEQSLERERAKYHWLDPLASPRSERLAALKDEKYSIDADALWRGFVELAYDTLRVHTVSLFIINSGKLQLVAARSDSALMSHDASFELGEGLIGFLAREGKSRVLNDLGEDVSRLGYYSGPVDVLSLATTPVQIAGRNFGILVADAARPFTEYDQNFLSELAFLLARDIEIAREYEERHREALRFSGLYEMAGNLLTGLSEEELIEKSFELARELFSPDALGFATLGEKQGIKVSRYDGSKDFEKGFRFEPAQSLVAMTAKHNGFLVHRDMTKPGLYRIGPGEKSPANRTFLGISFEEKEGTRGVLWLEKNEADAYSERDGKILGFAATLLGAAFLRVRYQEELARLARVDGLTGLLNHRAFQEELATAITKSPSLGLFIIDIDFFKKINDTYGHPVGDMVLKKIAEVIKDKGIAARYGGEEFALIISGVAQKEMHGRGEEVLAAIRRAMIRIREGTIQVTASVGGAFYPRDARTREELVRSADSALYKAKESGRNKLVLAGNGG